MTAAGRDRLRLARAGRAERASDVVARHCLKRDAGLGDSDLLDRGLGTSAGRRAVHRTSSSSPIAFRLNASRLALDAPAAQRPRHQAYDRGVAVLAAPFDLDVWATGVVSNIWHLHRAAESTGWNESLARSKAQIEAGQTVPLLPILDRLRASAERLEVAQERSPDEASQTAG